MREEIENLISIIIPCYGSEKTVAGVIDEINQRFSEQNKYDYEVIAVNDGSPDNVIASLEECAAKNDKVKVVDLAINSGKHHAILAGYSFVRGQIAITVDDDGQCPLDRIWDLVAPLENGYDMSMAKYASKKESTLKKMGSKVNSRMSRWLLNKPKGVVFTNFIARKRFVVDAMSNYHMPYAYLEGLSLKTTRNIALVDMDERKRVAGKSGYTFAKSFKLMMNGYTAFSPKPLRISAGIGGLLSFSGAIYMIVSLILKLCNVCFDFKYHLLIAILLFLVGLILLSLGLVGEYVGRIFVAQNNANQFVVRKTININK